MPDELMGAGRVQVTRTIIVEGPVDLVRKQLAQSWLSLDGPRQSSAGGLLVQFERTREIHYLNDTDAQYDVTISRADS